MRKLQNYTVLDTAPHPWGSDDSHYLLIELDYGPEHDPRYTCVLRAGDSFRSFMPGDRPRDGGEWTAPATTSGLDYVVSRTYSRGHARRAFRERARADSLDDL